MSSKRECFNTATVARTGLWGEQRLLVTIRDLASPVKIEVILEGLSEEVGAREGWDSWTDPGLLLQRLQLLELLSPTQFWVPGAY